MQFFTEKKIEIYLFYLISLGIICYKFWNKKLLKSEDKNIIKAQIIVKKNIIMLV